MLNTVFVMRSRATRNESVFPSTPSPMNMQSKCISRTCLSAPLGLRQSATLFSSPSHDALPAPTVRRKMRHFVFVFFSCSIGRLDRAFTWSSSLRTPPLLHALPFLQLLTHDVADPFDFRHASFRSRSAFPLCLTAFTHLFRVFSSRQPPENRIHVLCVESQRKMRHFVFVFFLLGGRLDLIDNNGKDKTHTTVKIENLRLIRSFAGGLSREVTTRCSRCR